jgi:hypothetical protein
MVHGAIQDFEDIFLIAGADWLCRSMVKLSGSRMGVGTIVPMVA